MFDYSIEIMLLIGVLYLIFDIYQAFFKQGESMSDDDLMSRYIEHQRRMRTRFPKGE